MEEVDGVPLVGSGEAVVVGAILVWPCVVVAVGVVDGVLLGGGGAATLVRVWPCVTVLVEVGDRVPLVDSGVVASVGVCLPVGCATLVLLVVLGSVE